MADALKSVISDEPQMKGIGFANIKNYVRDEHGQLAWQRTLQELGPYREEVETAIAVGWYSVKHFAVLLRTVDRICGKGDLSLLREVGAAEADQDLHRVLRLFLRVLTPSAIFKVEGRLWSHFQDSGTWTSRKVEGGVDAELVGWEVDEALCMELAGYLARLLEFTGAANVSVKHRTCRAKGAASCVFEYRYRDV